MADEIEDPDVDALRSAASEGEAFAALYESYRPRLERAVTLRMDPRVRARVDATDVVQETYIECAHRLPSYLEAPPAPVFLWVRYLVLQRLLQMHRQHLGRAARDAGREVRIDRGAYPGATSNVLAGELIASQTSPSGAAARAELKRHVEEALDQLGDLDREILVLRHFEHMTSAEAAIVLGIAHDAARKRYLRALKRLRPVFEEIDGLAR